MMGELSNAIMKKIKNSDTVAVDYPATSEDPPYQVSEGLGVKQATKMIKEYSSGCPGSDIVLLGYSQVSILILFKSARDY
jgi:hypothetical protein